ncbi:MAG: chemotaxis protein CheW, partial [Spirochaetia bacterium]
MEQFRLIHIDDIPFLFRENPGLVFTQITGVHRLPLMPGCMAGVSLVDGSSVSFADLAAFLEMRTHTEAPRRNAVIFPSAKNRLGFLWHGKQEKIQIEEDRVYQLPEFLQTGLIDSCVSFNGSLIPVIEPNTLRTLIKEAGPLEQKQRLIISGKNKSTAAFKRIYLFGHHKERYAVDASLVTEVSAVPRHVRQLPHLPPYVKGIFLYKEHPIPLMDIGELLKLPKTRKPKACIIIAMNGNTIGLLTESQPAQKTTDSSGLYSLPPLVSAGFLHTIIENQKKLVPCIDIFAMFREENTDEKTYSYTVSGEFSGRFLKRECEVIEFSLFGVKHAVPKTEVEDIIPYSPVRGLPLKLPILIGVKRRNDEIVPVIDIARCFNIFSFT